MPVKFNVIPRKNPSKPEESQKYYPSVVSSGRVTMRDLAEMAAAQSTLSTMDMMAAYESLLALIPAELAKGNVVELGDFGNFWLRNNGAGAETPEAVNAGHITKVQARFNPGRLFKDVLNAIRFEKAG